MGGREGRREREKERERGGDERKSRKRRRERVKENKINERNERKYTKNLFSYLLRPPPSSPPPPLLLLLLLSLSPPTLGVCRSSRPRETDNKTAHSPATLLPTNACMGSVTGCVKKKMVEVFFQLRKQEVKLTFKEREEEKKEDI